MTDAGAVVLRPGKEVRRPEAGLAEGGDLLWVAPVVHWSGPESVMHLLSAISLIDSDLAVAYLPLPAVETVELLRERGIGFVEGRLASGHGGPHHRR